MFSDASDIEMAYCSRDGQIKEALDERGIKFFPMKKLCVSEVKRVIKEYEPDVIHAHDFNAAFNAALACGKIPLITHVHFNDVRARKLSVKSIASLIPVKKSKHIFWVSDSAFDQYYFKKCAKNKSEVLYNLIDIDALYKKMESDTDSYDYDVAYVGRITYQKHPERLIEVISKAVALKPDLKVAVVGTGDLENIAKTKAKELGVENNIDFLGFKSNPLKIIHCAKALIMTSRYEGTPMSALESLALGTPIVSTPTDGLCDIIDDGVNGYISDDDDILAERLKSIVLDDLLYLKLSDSAKILANKQNDINTYFKRLEVHYK